MNDEKPNKNGELLFPGIDEYLESINYGYPISLGGTELDIFVKLINSYTTLNDENSGIILRLIFEEIRKALLRGEIINLRGFGSFYVSSPKVSGNKERVFIRFRPSKILRQRLNAK